MKILLAPHTCRSHVICRYIARDARSIITNFHFDSDLKWYEPWQASLKGFMFLFLFALHMMQYRQTAVCMPWLGLRVSLLFKPTSHSEHKIL